jgi:uncharacterized protein YecT (DUF1311 family)
LAWQTLYSITQAVPGQPDDINTEVPASIKPLNVVCKPKLQIKMRLFNPIILLALISTNDAFGQLKLTREVEMKLNASIAKEASAYAKKLSDSNIDKELIEFSIDTFKVERFMAECLSLEMSDFGMSEIAYKGAKQYDSLLNKYYKKLLTTLKDDDKKVLTNAQKSWLSFRDNEFKLIELISNDEYSGGGTMQNLTESSEYLNLVKARTIAIFEHWQRATQTY